MGGSVFQNDCVDNVNPGDVNLEISSDIPLFLVSFVALVAFERPLPSVCHHVFLQLTRRNTGEVALVALEWLFSCVLSHLVLFQMASCNT